MRAHPEFSGEDVDFEVYCTVLEAEVDTGVWAPIIQDWLAAPHCNEVEVMQCCSFATDAERWQCDAVDSIR